MRRAILTHLWAQILLCVALVAVVNHLSAARFVRLDLTVDRRHTLSPATVEVLAGLERPVVVRAWLSEGLQPPYHDHTRQIWELLEELRARSGGRLLLERVDPDGDRSLAAQAERAGVHPLPLRRQVGRSAELRQVFLGVSLESGDRAAAADGLVRAEGLEEELLRALIAVTTPEGQRPTLAYVQGHGEPDLSAFPEQHPLGKLAAHLRVTGALAPLTLGGADGVPGDVDALLVIGSQAPWSAREVFQLDQFLMRGGRAALFLSSVRGDLAALRADPVDHGLQGLLGHYGVRLDKSALIDRSHRERVTLPVEVGGRRHRVSLDYPLVPWTTDLSRELWPVRRLERVVLPFASPVSLIEPLIPGVRGAVWARSMEGSSAAHGLIHLDIEALSAPPVAEEQGPFPVVVGLEGRLRSAFSGVGLPPLPSGEPAPEDPLSVLLDGEPSRLVVAGSSDMVANNLPLVENAVAWLLEDPRLAEVRGRRAQGAALPELSPAQAWATRGLVVGTPLVLLWGALLLWRRR
ncbi:MAG: GldG family protein [Deltaproteobacteria bacterium]|nr:GldG family protein [Deltaproteobacteria bacterium]